MTFTRTVDCGRTSLHGDGHVKTIEGLTVEEERAAALFRALGNPARVRIVRELAAREGCQTGDLAGILPLAQSTVSEHLKVLREAGIIRGRVEGDRWYCLDPEVLGWLQEYCQGLLGSVEECC